MRLRSLSPSDIICGRTASVISPSSSLASFTNKILAARNHEISRKFSGPSAERNSIQLALELLFRPRFKAFRKAVLPNVQTKFEFGRFIFWTILCTDIASPDRLKNCKTRFEVVHAVRESIITSDDFDGDLWPILPYLQEIVKYMKLSDSDIKDHADEMIITQEKLERCVVMEHLTQISDVAHLMQSWENFLKWNFRLYKELMVCHEKGLMPDLSENWEQGQIGFYDNYVIPLANRTEQILIGRGNHPAFSFVSNAKKNLELIRTVKTLWRTSQAGNKLFTFGPSFFYT